MEKIEFSELKSRARSLNRGDIPAGQALTVSEVLDLFEQITFVPMSGDIPKRFTVTKDDIREGGQYNHLSERTLAWVAANCCLMASIM